VFGLTLQELQAVAGELGLPRYAGAQLARWLYGRHAAQFAEMTDLSREARAALAEHHSLDVGGPVKETLSRDGTKKYLFAAAQGRFVEAAFIPEPRRGTLCLSVQVGCKMGCVFCMTGRQGFAGNLSSGEILNQYRSLPEREAVTNIVYMGMGEPLDNLDNVLASLQVLTARWGYALSPRRITVSTVGLLPALERFLAVSRCHLAVSLHSPFQEERRALVPIEKAHPLREILAVLRTQHGHPLEGQRRLSFEYVLLRGINHSDAHAREMARILRGIPCRVNLIPFHPIPLREKGTGPGMDLAPCTPEETACFEKELQARGIPTTLRRSRGLDIQAACGLLSTRQLMEQPG
jgi:23S rRNA (adenine2503-C2)-methyltransferase